jgi:hypothetical protein
MEIAAVTTVGATARAALVRAGGRARVYAPLSTSLYVTAGEDIIWLATGGPAHARAVLCSDIPSACRRDGATVAVDVGHIAPWQPAPGPRTPAEAAAMVAGARALRDRLSVIGAPRGFASLCAGQQPGFPLDGSGARALALATACAAGDAKASAAAAVPLLGLGEGLTPSGDDFAGAAFFARTLLATAGNGDGACWRAAAHTVLGAAPGLTHPISVALLGDLLAGSGPAPLHDFAQALATGAPACVADDAARRLARIGHASGWDMLAGFIAGCGGLT